MLCIFILTIALVSRTEQHLTFPINYCTVAMACIHDSRPVCASSMDGCTRRNFLDQCDMFEYNCDYKAGYEMENCDLNSDEIKDCKDRSLLDKLPLDGYFHSIYPGHQGIHQGSNDNDGNNDVPKIVTKDPSDTTSRDPEKLTHPSHISSSTNRLRAPPCYSACQRPHTWGTTAKGETRDFFRILQSRDYEMNRDK